jgi:tryptophan-rich sensory protein
MKKPVGIVIAVVICELAGVVGSLFTTPSIPGWYASLTKPSFSPPNGIFGPVWITLYALMGIAAWLVYDKGRKRPEVRQALFVFAAQLVLNVLWSIMFFGAHRILGAFVIIVALWVLILGTILRFFRIAKPAAILLVPYLLWVGFAAVLNGSFYVLNR